jgi:hypothetical protein
LRAIDRYNLLNEAVTTATSYVSFNVTRTTKVLEFKPMKERNQNLIGQREKDNALLNFVNYQAQEAILSSVLPDEKKDRILKDAIETIHQVSERKAAYFAKHGEGRRRKRSA